MKSIKILSLAALAALMAAAFVGTSTVMAESTALCSEDPGTGTDEACPEGKIATHVHETSVGKGKLVTSAGTIECDGLFLSTSVGALASPQLIKGNFTYSNCTAGCTVTEENGPSEIEVLKEGHETGKVTGKGLVHAVCSFLNCRYIGKDLIGTAKGPLLSTQENGEVSVKEQSTTKESGTFCPTTSKLTITTTPLAALYITGSATALCKEDPGTGADEVCPEGQIATHVHETSVGKDKLVTSAGTIECDGLFLSTTGGVGALGTSQLIKGNFTYSNCTAGCTVTEENGPSEIEVLKEGHETGKVTGKGLVHAVCSFLNCRYIGKDLIGTAKGPLLSTQENGEVSVKEQSTTKESGTFCPTTSKLTITTTPLAALYITS